MALDVSARFSSRFDPSGCPNLSSRPIGTDDDEVAIDAVAAIGASGAKIEANAFLASLASLDRSDGSVWGAAGFEDEGPDTERTFDDDPHYLPGAVTSTELRESCERIAIPVDAAAPPKAMLLPPPPSRSRAVVIPKQPPPMRMIRQYAELAWLWLELTPLPQAQGAEPEEPPPTVPGKSLVGKKRGSRKRSTADSRRKVA